MRRGLLQDYANQIAQMFVGYQIGLVDMPLLVQAGKGRIQVDLFEGRSTLNGAPLPAFSISEAVRHWYSNAVARDQLSETFVRSITIDCDFEASESQSDRASLRIVALNCTVTVNAEDGSWVGTSSKQEESRRWEDGPWITRDA
jgi:hypothetical protein